MKTKVLLKSRAISFYVLWGVVTGSMFVIIPLYSQTLNFSFKQISVFVAIPNITLLFQPMWAFMIDYFQNPRKIVTVTTGLAASSILMLRVVTSFEAVVLFYFSYSLLINPLWITIDNIIFNTCDERKMIYSKIRNFASFAYGMSVIIILPLFALFPIANYFVFAFITYGLIIVVINKLPNRTNPSGEQTHKVTKGDILRLVTNRELCKLLVFSLLYGSLLALTIPYQTLLFTAANKSRLFIAIATFVTLIFEGLLLNKGTAFYQKRGIKLTLLLAVAVLLLRSVILPQVESDISLLIVSSLYGVSTALYIPLLMAYSRTIAGDLLSNSALMLANFSSSIGSIAITYLVTVLARSANVDIFYTISIIILILAGLVAITIKEPERKENNE